MNVLITGASKGIGYEIAKLMSKKEHSIIAIARSKFHLEALENECKNFNSKFYTICFDLISGDFNQLKNQIKSKFQHIDVLINNAGAIINKPFEQISDSELKSVYESNVFAPFKLIQSLMPFLTNNTASKKHIVNISSMGGFQGSSKFAGLSAYSSSKGALSILTECLAEELKDKNIAVNCLCLGAVQTEMLEKAFPGYKAPLSAKEMAEFITNFSLDAHHYFNGKVLPVSISTP